MEKERKSTLERTRNSMILYVAAVIVALIGIGLLINNILYYTNTVKQYVAQGYPASDVIKQLLPSQLLPGIFQPVAVYGGIAAILYGAGKIDKKVSSCITILSKPETFNDIDIDSIIKQPAADVEKTALEDTVDDDNTQ